MCMIWTTGGHDNGKADGSHAPRKGLLRGDEELLSPFEVQDDESGGLFALPLQDRLGDGLVLLAALGDALGILVLDPEDDAVELAAQALHDVADLLVPGELGEQ